MADFETKIFPQSLVYRGKVDTRIAFKRPQSVLFHYRNRNGPGRIDTRGFQNGSPSTKKSTNKLMCCTNSKTVPDLKCAGWHSINKFLIVESVSPTSSLHVDSWLEHPNSDANSCCCCCCFNCRLLLLTARRVKTTPQLRLFVLQVLSKVETT